MRLRHSRLLWIACGALAVYVVGLMGWQWFYSLKWGSVEEMREDLLRTGYMDHRLFTSGPVAVLLTSAVCGWFLGAEYQDGALRCKLSVGHKRRDVYLSSLLFTALACVLMCLAVFLPGTLFILATAGRFAMGWSRALWTMAGIAAVSLAFASLFTFLGLNISNRAASAIAAILVTVGLLLAGLTMTSRLREPPERVLFTVTVGDELINETAPNASYLPEGALREAVKFLTYFLPGGQLIDYANDMAETPGVFMAYDGLFFVLVSAAGLLIFRRKDLK